VTATTREMLKAFSPQHEWFIGFDSDGCIFDSMELKHKECFIPNIVKYFHLQAVSKYAREAAEFVNLYSFWRGANRFPALVKCFELLRDRPEVRRRNTQLPDWTSLQRFINAASALGNAALKEAVGKSGDEILKQTLEWSEAVNRDIEDMVKGLPPFPLVRESLHELQGSADMVVVSATPTEALRREWEEHKIQGYVALIAGQELGKKEEQLDLIASGKYPAGHLLMVGDALGDLKAARAVGALFYPIVPGKEDESWRRFHDDIREQFLAGKFDTKSEAACLAEFERALPKTPPWIRV
jgi:phosphoglycolate phosphatase-like HAD superfamily hydrolase